MRVKFFGIESKSKRRSVKGDMHVFITIESLIPAFQPKLIPMFFHIDFIRKFKSSIQSWRSTTIVIIIIGVKGIRDNKSEQQLLIANGEGEFDQDIFVFNNNFKTKCEQLLEV